jgi:hypothetical protein
MPEDNDERRFYRGSARWIIIGIVAAVAVYLWLFWHLAQHYSPVALE